jgi:hypothetical protein
MLFYTSKDGKALLQEDVYKLCPEFRVLKDEEVQYIVLVYDYCSPFNQLEEVDRKKQALKLSGLDKPESDPKIKAAIKMYIAMQYDTKRERIKTYREKIKTLDVQLRDPDLPPSRISQIITSQDTLEAKINDLESEIEFSMFSGELKGGRTKSYLEWMKENKKLHDMEMNQEEDISIQPAWEIPKMDE